MIHRLTSAFSLLWRELAKFGVIGVLNFVIDLGLFNLLVGGPLAHKITTAKFVSGGVATVFAWIGNRFWTFRDRRNRPVHHEVALFFLVNGIALLITTAWVAFAHTFAFEGEHDHAVTAYSTCARMFTGCVRSSIFNT